MWAGDKIIQKKDINISIAVATDDALFVPVIKNADEKTIKGIAREITDLAVKVRTGNLTVKIYKVEPLRSITQVHWLGSINGNYQLPSSSDFTSRIHR